MVDDDGKPLKFLSVGASAHGVIAIGAVARGVVAIGGAVSIGVVSIGVNAVGSVVGVGVNAVAPVSIAVANGGGIFAFVLVNGFGGFGAAGVNAGFTPILAFVFAVILAGVAFALPRRPLPSSIARPLTPLSELLAGNTDEGWIEARLDGANETGVVLQAGRARLEIAAAPGARAFAAQRPAPKRVFAQVRVEVRRVTADADYRAAPREERLLTCEALESAERPLRLTTVFRITLASSAVAGVAAGLVGVLR